MVFHDEVHTSSRASMTDGYEQQTFQIAPARLADFEAVAMLFAELHGYNASLNEKFALAPQWKQTLAEHFVHTVSLNETLWLLTWVDQRPVGLLILEMHRDSPLFQHRDRVELVALYVAPAYRGTPLAHLLMEHARKWSAERGEDCMQLYVTVQNERARAFYHRCGWHPVQEIWHLDVIPQGSRAAEPLDPSCAHEGKGATDVLESGHHHLVRNQEVSTDA